MATGAAVAMGAGTLLGTYAKYKESQSLEEAAEANADAKRLEAFEIIGRNEENIDIMKREAEVFKSRQQLQVAASGAAISSGASLMALETTNSLLMEEVSVRRRDANFRAEQALTGAKLADDKARNIRRNRPLEVAGGLLGGAGKIAGGLA